MGEGGHDGPDCRIPYNPSQFRGCLARTRSSRWLARALCATRGSVAMSLSKGQRFVMLRPEDSQTSRWH